VNATEQRFRDGLDGLVTESPTEECPDRLVLIRDAAWHDSLEREPHPCTRRQQIVLKGTAPGGRDPEYRRGGERVQPAGIEDERRSWRGCRNQPGTHAGGFAPPQRGGVVGQRWIQ